MSDHQLQAPAVPEQIRLVHAVEIPVEHVIKMVERGPFVVAQCAGCGWETFARRSRPLAYREGGDHVRLHRPAVSG
jgi:hypothetical protein